MTCKWTVNIYNERTFYNQTTKIQPSCSSTKCPEGDAALQRLINT